MKRFALLFTALVLSLVPASLFAQGTIAVSLNYTVTSPWQTPCSTSVLTNCIAGWRISEISSGALFDIAAPTSGFSGTISALGNGPIAVPTGAVVAQTIGIEGGGGELLSTVSAPVSFGAAPAPPTGLTVTVTVTVNP